MGKMMFLQNVLVIVTVAAIVEKSLAARPRNPCPDVFQYARSKGENVGIVTVNDVDYGDTVLDIKLSQFEDIESNYVGKISLNFDINKSSEYIETGTPFVYKVRFPLEDVIPRVQEIKLNGVAICSRGKKIPTSHSTIDLQHTLTVTAPFNRKQGKKPRVTTTKEPIRWPVTTKTTTTTTTTPRLNHQNNLPRFLVNTIINPQLSTDNAEPPKRTNGLIFGTVPPDAIRTFTTTTTTTAAPRLPLNFFSTSTNQPPQITLPFVPNTNTRFNFIQKPNEQEWRDIGRFCGLENLVDVNQLVVNGTDVPKSRFPWIVAIFLKNAGSPSFQCGGSLITTRTVISAAHCFHLDTQHPIEEENVLVSMGRHFLDESFESGGEVINSDVEKIIRHPDYRLEFDINDADVAIVQLKERVEFTVFIRPVCMWEDVLDVQAIQGLSGIIVGWGRDEHGNRLTRTPKLASAKVVSESTCLRSNEKFSSLTSSRTLCAGNRDGTGPCKGDSGSGLMILIRNKWRLRGTVSRSLSSKDEICDLKHYVLYTDIAQFLGWIFNNSVF